jgi:hypothetical protein
MGSARKRHSLVTLHLTQIGPNDFEDAETNTRFTFLMHPLSVQEAERRAYALMRLFADASRLDRFYGRTHVVPATGKLPGHPGLSC